MRQNNRRVYLRMDGGLGSFCSPLSSFFLSFSIFPGRLACRDCLKRLLCSQMGIGHLDGGRRMKLGYLLPLFLSLQIPLLSCDPLLVATNTLRYLLLHCSLQVLVHVPSPPASGLREVMGPYCCSPWGAVLSPVGVPKPCPYLCIEPLYHHFSPLDIWHLFPARALTDR